MGNVSRSLAVAALALACLAPPAAAQGNPTVPALRSPTVPPLGRTTAAPRRQPATAPGAPAKLGPRATAPNVPRSTVKRRSGGQGIGRDKLINPRVLDHFHANRHEFSGFSLREVRINGVRKFLVVLHRR